MTIRNLLSEESRSFPHHITCTPHLDAALLLAHAYGIDRARLYMNMREEVQKAELLSFRKMIARRLEGEPVAWIIGIKEFWGLDFRVGPGVLCPRPDSETVVETTLKFMGRSQRGRLHDCCCGPGTLSVALSVEQPHWYISASDISETAGSYFALNNDTLAEGQVRFIRADLLSAVDAPVDIIVSNPPYLTSEEINRLLGSGLKEPVLALNGGGKDGLSLMRRIIGEAPARLCTGGVLILEAASWQMPIIRMILSDNDFHDIIIRKDLGGRDRVIYGSYGRKNEFDTTEFNTHQ